MFISMVSLEKFSFFIVLTLTQVIKLNKYKRKDK